jgi:hypothetical protein
VAFPGIYARCVSTVPLFDDRLRNDADYRRPDETTYTFLDRVSRPDLAAPREMLNPWFDRWPADDREQLRARLMGKQPSDFDGAFWELYLHEVHSRLGFTITREPEMAGLPTRPDFLMERDDGAFYLEATVVGRSAREIADQRRVDAVIAIMNEAYHPDFSVRLDSFASGPQQAAKRKIVAAVERWLGTLDWSIERSRMTDSRREPHHIEVDGTHLFVSPYPRDPEVRGDRSWPTVLSGPRRFGVKDEPPMILDDLEARPASSAGRTSPMSSPCSASATSSVNSTLSRRCSAQRSSASRSALTARWATLGSTAIRRGSGSAASASRRLASRRC